MHYVLSFIFAVPNIIFCDARSNNENVQYFGLKQRGYKICGYNITRNLIIQMHLKVCKNYDGYVFHRRVACRRDVIQSVWNIFAKQYNDFKNE